MNGETSFLIEEIKKQHAEGTLSQKQTVDFLCLALARISNNGEKFVNRLDNLERIMDKRFDKLDGKVDKAVEHQTTHPSLIYLLRFKTRQTVAALIFAFVIFSSWFVSSVRQPILEFLGLPVF